jgi:hypothetical protein
MAKDKNKIPIKEREGFKKFLNIFPKVASGVLNVAGLVVPGASAAGKVIGAIDGMVNSGEITNEYAIQAKNYLLEHEKDIFALEVADRQSAREMYKVDNVLQKGFALTFLAGYLAIIIFLMGAMFGFTIALEPWEISLVSAIFGGMSAKVNTITDFLFGSSQGSKDKTEKLSTIMNGDK